MEEQRSFLVGIFHPAAGCIQLETTQPSLPRDADVAGVTMWVEQLDLVNVATAQFHDDFLTNSVHNVAHSSPAYCTIADYPRRQL